MKPKPQPPERMSTLAPAADDWQAAVAMCRGVPAGIRLAALVRLRAPEATQKELAEATGLCVRQIQRGDALVAELKNTTVQSCDTTVQSRPTERPTTVQSSFVDGTPHALKDLKILRSLSLSSRAREPAAPAPPAPPGDRFAAPLASRASPQEAREENEAPSAPARLSARALGTTAAIRPLRSETRERPLFDRAAAEEAENEGEQAARRLLARWSRVFSSPMKSYPRAWIDACRERLEEFDEATLERAIDGCRFALWFRDAPEARCIPPLILRDARNVTQAAAACPRRVRKQARPAPRAEPSPPTENDVTGARAVLSALAGFGR